MTNKEEKREITDEAETNAKYCSAECAINDRQKTNTSNFNKVMFSSANDNWSTPKDVFDVLNGEFKFNYDPCPLADVPNFDGLAESWGTRTFVNPPYSNIAKWCAKAFQEWKTGKTVVMLIPSRTDTRYWHDYIMKATEIRFIKGRLKFGNAKSNAPFPSAIIVFKPTH